MMTLSTTILKLRAMDTDLFIISTREPVHPLRHRNLKPGSFARRAVLCDGDARDCHRTVQKKSGEGLSPAVMRGGRAQQSAGLEPAFRRNPLSSLISMLHYAGYKP